MSFVLKLSVQFLSLMLFCLLDSPFGCNSWLILNRISLLIWWSPQMLALLLIQVGCQQLYAFDTLNISVSLFVYVLAVLANLPRSRYLYQWTKNWISLIYFSFLSILLVAWMCISGANKRDKCPSSLLRLLWRSLSSWSLLHKHCNWSSSHISCMSMLLHCFSFFFFFSFSSKLLCIIAFKSIEFCCLIWFDSKWCFCLVDSNKPVQAAHGGWKQCSTSSLL